MKGREAMDQKPWKNCLGWEKGYQAEKYSPKKRLEIRRRKKTVTFH